MLLTVFAPEGTTFTFMTQDVGRAIERLKPTNALVEQLSEIEQMVWSLLRAQLRVN